MIVVTRILAVEDDESIRILLRDMLERSGHSVDTAPNAKLALDALERDDSPDLILLDLNMPGMDGISLCKQIRQRPATRETPILIVSAQDDLDSLRDAKAAGANDYIVKPIAYTELIITVRRLLADKL